MSEDNIPPSKPSKLFQIYEEDLAELERLLPELFDLRSLANREKIKVRRIQTILSQVRWNYGPAIEIHKISAERVDELNGPDGPPDCTIDPPPDDERDDSDDPDPADDNA